MIEFLPILWITIKIFWVQALTWCPVLTISVASLCYGFMIGFERELSDKPAGLRTTMLVMFGAALFTFMSPIMADINTTRIAANVVVGIGFIGAGTIIRNKGQIQGITTAATMWICAAIGMMIGAMRYFDAFIVTIFVVLILNVLGRVEYLRKCNKGKENDH